MTEFVRAVTSGVTMNNFNEPAGDQTVVLQRGDVYPSTHWAVREAPERFEVADLHPADAEAAEALTDVRREISAHLQRANGDEQRLAPGTRQRLDGLRTRELRLQQQLRAATERRDTALRNLDNPRAQERVNLQPTPRSNDPVHNGRDAARRTLDLLARDGRVPDDGVERLTRSMEHAESLAPVDDRELTVLSRWLRVAGDPAYARACGKLFRDAEHGHREFDNDELRAYQNAKSLQRAMNIGTDSAGGFLVPVHLDPAVMLSSAGVVDPMRQLARTVTIATSEWNGISSAGVEASWYGEAAEVSDDSPTFDGPSIKVHRASAFVAASLEAAADTNISNELAMLFADAKATLEADAFVTGAGDASNEPRGLVTALAGGAQAVATGAAGTYARDDILGLQEAVPPRFRQGAAFQAALEIVNATREFPRLASGSETSLVDDSGNVPRVRGWQLAENSSMDAAVSTGNHIAAAGNFRRGYTIVDRVGMTVEYLPHLLGANRRPTGERGWFAYWRVGGDVVVPEALRLLTVA